MVNEYLPREQYHELNIVKDGRMYIGADWDPTNTDDWMAIGPYVNGGDEVFLMDPTPVYAIHTDDAQRQKRAWLKVSVLLMPETDPTLREVGCAP